MFPDYSWKYHGKLNDKESSNDGKISNNATVRKKVSTEKLSEIKRENITGKIVVRSCAKTWIRVRHVKIIKTVFAPKSRLPHVR